MIKISKKYTLASALLFLALTCSSFSQHPWQHEHGGICTDNVLHQFYPDQNACRLLQNIPSSLQNLPYAIYPPCKGYDTARFNFNKRFNYFPSAIFTPRTAKEVAYVVKTLRKHHLKFSIRSGGHCTEPGSLSPGYIIDLRNFSELKLDIKGKQVYVGAGCRLGSVIEALGKHGLAIPTGTCSSVGAMGLALGGGTGVLGRVLGLTCDSIQSIIMVTANGKVIEVNRKKHSDLFWALRGAGNGSYGIILGITFKTHYIPKVSYLSLKWKWDPTTVHKVVQAWQSWIVSLPNTITTQLHLKYLNDKLSLEVVGLKVGTKAFTEWKKAFRHLHPKAKVTKMSYLDSAQQWADRAPFPFFKSKSEILMEPLSTEPVQTAIDFFEELKNKKENYYAFFELEAWGGKIAKGNTAFFPRKALGWWYQVIYWDKPTQEKRALHKLRKFHANIAPFVSEYAYANIVDYDLKEHYLNAYYGDHINRLIKIKNKYDPKNIFHWKQSIPLSQ